MYLRKIIRGILSEEVFNEAAKRIENLSDKTALFVKKLNSGYTLSLYDPSENKIYSTITFIKGSRDKNYWVSGVASINGYGPFIYELAMMISHKDGAGLMPSRDGDVRGVAFNVWEKFYDRSDVDKETIPFGDEDFSFRIFDDHDYLSLEDKEEWLKNIEDDKNLNIETLYIFNTAFSMAPDSSLGELIDRGNKWIDKGFDVDKAFEAADDFWQYEYNR